MTSGIGNDPADDPYLDRCHDQVGGAPAIMGPWQVDLLTGLGLRPTATLLDLGCGTLRGGLHFIRFLDVGRYVGVDPHVELLALGDALVTRAGLQWKLPSLFTLEEHDARDARYEWALTQSVLNHLDADGTVATVDRVARALAPGGRWVSTVRLDRTVERVEAGAPHGRRPAEFWRSRTNPDWLNAILAARGFAWEVLPEAAHPRGMDVFVATRLAAHPA